MAQEDVRLSGTFLDSAGNALASKTVTLFSEGTITPALATDTTDSSGEWDFTRTTPGRYDVQLVTGTQTYRILSRDKFQVTELQARNPTTAQPALSAYSTTSEAASLVATFGFRPATESSGVETPDTPSDGDLGYIDFTLSNDHTDKQEWITGRIAWEGADVSDGSEDGQFNFWTMTAGTLVEELHLNGAALWPETDAGLDLGTSALGFNDLHLGSGGVINFDGGDVTLTHSSNTLTAAGGTFATAALTATTVDASTDFTIGDTVITDGVVTDSTGLQLAANLDINGTVDISGDLTLSAGADGALQFTNAGENSIKIPDNQASALIIEEANNAYITFVTTDSSESVTFGKAVDLGSNTLTSTGSLQIRTIDYSDGDLAITIADGGGTTFAQDATFSGVLDVTDATDASDATGDTGALRTEGGASIAKKLYVGTDLDVTGNTTLNGDVTLGNAASDVITVNGTVAGANAVIFEGNSADGSETTLAVVDPTSDHTVYMPNQGGYLGVFDAASTTQITATPAEINLIDGGTARGTTAIADGDGVLINDDGTMRMTTVQTLATYLAGVNAGTVTSTGLSDSSGVLTLDIQNMTGSTTIADADLVVVDDGADGTLRKMTRANFIESAALDAINIDGGAIDGVTLGTNSAVTQAVIDNININGTTIGHTSDTDLLTLTSGNLAVAGDVALAATKKLYLDGGGDTYIYEESGDDLHIVVGGVAMIELDQDGPITRLKGPVEIRNIAGDGNSAVKQTTGNIQGTTSTPVNLGYDLGGSGGDTAFIYVNSIRMDTGYWGHGHLLFVHDNQIVEVAAVGDGESDASYAMSGGQVTIAFSSGTWDTTWWILDAASPD